MPEETEDNIWETICPPECSSLIKCVFCQKDLTEMSEDITSAQLLLCFHSVCRTCVESWKNEGLKNCPTCHIPLRKILLENKLLQECVEQPQSDSFRKGMCDMHPENPANRWCNDCRSLVCDFCIDNHKNLKSTRSHKIVDVNDGSLNSNISLVDFSCEEHKSMQLEIYCSTCSVMTCRDCQLEKHKQHAYTFINDLCKDYKKDLIYRRARMRLDMQIHPFFMAEETIMASHKASEEMRKGLLDQKKELHVSIDRTFELLMDALKTRFLELKNQVDSLIDDDIKTVTDKMNITTKVVKPVKHCISIIDLFLHHSSDPTVIFSKKQLEKFFKILSVRSVEVVNPNVKRKVNFSMPNQQLPNLLDSIKTIGEFSSNTMGSPTTVTNNSTEHEREERAPPKVTSNDAPPPVRIQLRQDLQSADPLRSQDRVENMNSPDNATKPNWHTPEGRPPSDLTTPALQSCTSSETPGRIPANQLKPPIQLLELLQTNNKYLHPPKSTHTPNVQACLSNQRTAPTRPAPQPEARYSVTLHKTVSYSGMIPVEPNPSSSGHYPQMGPSTVDPTQTTSTTYYAQNTITPLPIAYPTSASAALVGSDRSRRHKDVASRQNPHHYLQEHRTAASSVPIQYPPQPSTNMNPMTNQFNSLPQFSTIQLARQSGPGLQVPTTQEMLYFPGSTHNPYPSN